MTNWSWKFYTARVANEGGLADVVKSIGYELTGTRLVADGSDEDDAPDEKSFIIGGETALGNPNPANFTPFASLTKADLVTIVGTAVNIEALKAQIDAWHDEQVKPLPFETAA